jgi:hypothetical protein
MREVKDPLVELERLIENTPFVGKALSADIPLSRLELFTQSCQGEGHSVI